ncbi:unnamed protein product [Rhizoctonia solani]|uniref:Rho-GAP domain-containing protein n=1 Tax=Rhizoctonia solani TaxID=456999 RepID=A0A8H3DJZ9_9AGAM|nr:unnamed protein product [Rhizoctonia solani]
MAEERVLSIAPSIVDPAGRSKVRPTRAGIGLEYVYTPSDDGVDENLLVVLHGLGDTMAPFVSMAKQLKLPQTATLVLQAPDLIPFLEEGEEMYQWYTSFTSLGELIERPNPLPAVEKIHKAVEYLRDECRWPSVRIHLFGFAQGGSVALESALRLPGGLKSVVSIGGGLVESPTRAGPGSGTRVLYAGPSTDEGGLRKGFGNVRIELMDSVRMPRGQDEWGRVMRFWSEAQFWIGILPDHDEPSSGAGSFVLFLVDLANLVSAPSGSRSRASTTVQTPTPPGLGPYQRRSLGVIDERPRRDSTNHQQGGNHNQAPLSAYARILAKFRRQASEGHVPVSVPPIAVQNKTQAPRRTLRKRTSQSIRPATPPRTVTTTTATTTSTSATTPNKRRDPIRRTTSPVPFNPPNISNNPPTIPSNIPPPAPIPVPTPVLTPRIPRTGTGVGNTPPPDMHRPASPPATRQNLKSWWKQFKNAQGAILKRDPEDLVKHTPHTVFGIPLRESLRYASVQISTANHQGELYVWGYIPVVVAKCGLFLKENATEVEGVFRINGSNKRMRDLQSIFESPPRYGKDLNWKHESYTSHDVASVFRRYLTQMPEPVIPTEQYHAFRAALASKSKGEAEVIQTYRKLIREMPRANQYLLLYVLDLLSVFARKSDKNLMTESNLAVIFRPGIISLPAHEMKPTEHALSQEVLVFLIQHQDHFMLDPPARGDSIMLSSGMSPGIERSTYLSQHPGQFSPGVERPGYIVPSDSDEDPPPGGYKLVERRRESASTITRRRSLNDPTSNVGPLTAEPESIGSESPVTGESGGGKVKRSRTVPSQRGGSVLESSGGQRRATRRLDTVGSVGSTVESGIASSIGSGVGGSAIERDSAATPTSTRAVVNAVPPPNSMSS